MVVEGNVRQQLVHGVLLTIDGIFSPIQFDAESTGCLGLTREMSRQSMGPVRGVHFNGIYRLHSARSFHSPRGLQHQEQCAHILTATNGHQFTEDPGNWWNRVEEKDRYDLKSFRAAGFSGMSAEVLDKLCGEWVYKKRKVMLLGSTESEIVKEVTPMWVCIHQTSYDASNQAQLFVSILPIVEDVLAERILEGHPQARVDGLTFKDCDSQFGHWHNFFIGIRGSIAGSEEHVYWPNWLYHDSRRVVNCRDWKDVALFLADATEESLISHLEKTKQLQQDRGYHEGWCYHRMKDRWGQEPLVKFNIDI